MPIYATPSFCAAAAIGPTGNPTTPKRWFMPCCLRLLAINVAPSTSDMLFLLFDGRTRHVRWRRTRRAGDYAFMADRGRDPVRESKIDEARVPYEVLHGGEPRVSWACIR